MNMKPWIKTVSSAIVITLAFAAGSANAGGYAYRSQDSSRAVYDYARVLSAEPVVRYVTVTTPVKECWQDTEYYTVDHRPAGVGGKTLFGAILGGVIGHQFGGGNGKDVATVAGSLIGASIASETARNRGGYRTTEHSRPVTRCETRQTSHQEERIDGYRVIYAYNGQKYATQMKNDPGSRMRIRVDVRPAQ
jgi:uncharacterized protein YcfJ